MKKALITGINGFAGSYLAEYLISTGKEVSGTVLEGESLENLSAIRERVKLIPCRIQEKEEVQDAVRQVLPDEVYHLAGMAFVADSWQDPGMAFAVNAMGTMNLYEACIRARISPWIVSVLSADVYGVLREEEMPIREEQPLRPVHPYGLSKATADLIGYHYFYAYNLPIIRVRPFNHIGPRQNPKFVCSDFACQIAAIELGLHEPFIETGNLDARRDFTDVRDMVRAYGMLAVAGKPGEVYHVSSGKAVSIQSILDLFLEMARVKIEIRVNPAKLRRSDVPLQVGDSTRLRTQTGWAPEIPLQKTLEDILEYWRKELAARKK